MNIPQNFSHPYGFCPKCNVPLVYNRYNQMIVCPERGCDYVREYKTQDDISVNDKLAEEFTRNQKFDKLYENENNGSKVNDESKNKIPSPLVGRKNGKPVTTFLNFCEYLEMHKEADSHLMENIFDKIDERKG